MRAVLPRLGLLILNGLLLAWALFNGAMNWIGRTTVVDDFNLFVSRLPGLLEWLYQTPWWVPAILALIVTGILTWLSLPTSTPTPAVIKNKPISVDQNTLAVKELRLAPLYSRADSDRISNDLFRLYEIIRHIESGVLSPCSAIIANFDTKLSPGAFEELEIGLSAQRESLSSRISEVQRIIEASYFTDEITNLLRSSSDFEQNLRRIHQIMGEYIDTIKLVKRYGGAPDLKQVAIAPRNSALSNAISEAYKGAKMARGAIVKRRADIASGLSLASAP